VGAHTLRVGVEHRPLAILDGMHYTGETHSYICCEARHAATHSIFSALQVAGWTAALIAAGLDPQLPTAWLAEGLLYYLEPSCVGAMLQVSNVSSETLLRHTILNSIMPAFGSVTSM
jgi:hypothetical protein